MSTSHHNAHPMVHLDLHFSANHLLKMNRLSKSNPFVVVFHLDRHHAWAEVGRTDTVVDSHRCTFGRGVSLAFLSGTNVRVKLEVWSRDSAREQLSGHDFIGAAETCSERLEELAESGECEELQLVHDAKKDSKGGELSVMVEKRMSKRRVRMLRLSMQLAGVGHAKVPPRVQIEVQRERAGRDEKYVGVFRSDWMAPLAGGMGDGKEDHVVRFKQIEVNFDDLCNVDENGKRDEGTKLRVVLFVKEKKGGTVVGFVETSAEDLVSRSGTLRTLTKLKGLGDIEVGVLDLGEGHSLRHRHRDGRSHGHGHGRGLFHGHGHGLLHRHGHGHGHKQEQEHEQEQEQEQETEQEQKHGLEQEQEHGDGIVKLEDLMISFEEVTIVV